MNKIYNSKILAAPNKIVLDKLLYEFGTEEIPEVYDSYYMTIPKRPIPYGFYFSIVHDVSCTYNCQGRKLYTVSYVLLTYVQQVLAMNNQLPLYYENTAYVHSETYIDGTQKWNDFMGDMSFILTGCKANTLNTKEIKDVIQVCIVYTQNNASSILYSRPAYVQDFFISRSIKNKMLNMLNFV